MGEKTPMLFVILKSGLKKGNKKNEEKINPHRANA